MAFNNKKVTTYAKALRLTPEQFARFVIRLAGYLKNGITPEQIMNSMFIYIEICNEADEVLKSKEYTWGMSNPTYVKYGWEIEKWYLEGKGVRSISKMLKELHNVKASKSDIHRFLQNNEVYRG